EDAYGNVVANDNTDQVTLTILSNPGNGQLMGTTTVTVVNGLAQFTNLAINAAGQLYSLQATSGSLTSATSATFNINPGTGPKAAAIWDNTAKAYFIYVWAESDNQIEPLNSSQDGGTDSCSITIYNPDGTVNDNPSLTIGGPHAVPNECVSSAWTPQPYHSVASFANGYTASVTITGATPCGTGAGSGINWSDPSGLGVSSPCTATIPFPLSCSGSVIQDSYGNTINWQDIGVIKAKTDTINWQDVGVIKANTQNENWQDIGVLMTNVSSIKSFTDMTANGLNGLGINWQDFAVETNKGVNWADIAKLSAKGINWTDMSVLSNVGINWNDFNVLSNKGINWDDVKKLYGMGINWNDLSILGRAGINWDDLGIFSKSGINWYDLAVMSTANVKWNEGINWYDLAALTHAGVNWSDLDVLSVNNINWYDFRVLSDAGINWNDFNVLSTAGLNWNDLGVLGKAGINWSDFGVLSKVGINWNDFGVLRNRSVTFRTSRFDTELISIISPYSTATKSIKSRC
ncbi:MAG: hypothetical protein HQL12_05740, partial [Candidatus Omnitrophica bacterium]|nr:hypothetical protein [Candidatus Omnitrophota bacterium]